ncbi:M23 family metallopeptidase [Cellulomonas triticagri]|uniref:M23 family metallopeptidase n=1 Tax=Cellulomonas triticagri TaxID=2483352 RepID=A0A3M2JM95_9CELL|nr:M23 family metallopeptidase [Cellulomonas triticagri]RMI13391.1 M23 family metallopeptidase [Cellulomonas triticagri]
MATWGTPIEHGRFTAPFGQQRPTGVHLGTDIGPPRPGQTGVPVYAMGPGTVNRVGYTSIRGHWLLVVHDDGTYSRYQHLATAPTVGAGQRVQAATRVGTCGETGRATGIHLHLEAYPAGPNPGESQNGAINPETWASARGINLRALGALPTTPEDDMPLNDADKAWINAAIKAQTELALRVQFAPSGEVSERQRIQLDERVNLALRQQFTPSGEVSNRVVNLLTTQTTDIVARVKA